MTLTYDRAIEVFTHGSSDVDEVLEANKMAFEAMKRLLPMKPRKRTMYYPMCPQCGHTIDQADGKPKHCRYCGQALLWEAN